MAGGARGRAVFEVRLAPRGGRDAVEGVDAEGLLRVRVAAPPVDGAANRALLRLLSAELDIAPSRLALVAGESARRKRVAVEGIGPDVLAARWPGLRVAEG